MPTTRRAAFPTIALPTIAMLAATLAALPALVGCATCNKACCTETACGSDCEEGCAACAAKALEPKDAAADQQMLSRIKSLEGEWEMEDENGNWNTASVVAVSSNGSVVRQVMFPGAAHEMTNLYHMDGSDAVVTHYCAVGNQPRMVAPKMTSTPEGDAIAFDFDSVSNLLPSHDHVMGKLRLVFLDDNHFREDWTSMDRDGNVASEMSFTYRRKQ